MTNPDITDTTSLRTDNKTKKVAIRDMTPEQTAQAIKNVAKNIREGSYKMREAVKAIRESGAIDELTEAVREATIAARDTAKEISDTTKDLKERGVIKETASAVEETTMIAHKTVQSVRDVARDAAETTPQTVDTVKKGAEQVKKKARKRTTEEQEALTAEAVS